MKDRGEGLSVPRTDFTFFLDPAEQQALQEANSSHLVHYISKQPHMLLHFFHELWRNNRGEAIYQAVRRLDRIMISRNITTKNTSFVMGAMHALYSEPLPTCESFYKETLTLIIKGIGDVPINAELNPLAKDLIDNATSQVIENARLVRHSYKARLN